MPYLSVVAATRNDDHGGDLLYRTQLFVTGLIEQCERHRLDAELILVEWNPPEDRSRLADALRWPKERTRCAARIIEVPGDIHARFDHSDRLPLFQMIAKNAGIRRARGEFVLATNIDILFSDDLMRFLAARKLKHGCFYRVDRYDVTPDIDGQASIIEQLTHCERSIIRIHKREGTLDTRTHAFYRIYDKADVMLPPLLARWYKLVRYGGPWTARFVRRWTLRAFARIVHRQDPERTHLPPGSLLRVFRAMARLQIDHWKRKWLIEKARPKLHTNASGDFTLQSRDDWFAMRAYPELEMYSMHLDSLQLYQSYWSGLREHSLRMPIYHVEHATGSGFKPDDEGQRELNERLARAAIPQISYPQLVEWAVEMYRTRGPIEFNTPGWGLAREQLQEAVPGSLAREPARAEAITATAEGR